MGNPGQLEPLVERPYRTDIVSAVGNSDLPTLAFLVGLALRNGDDYASSPPLDRLAVDADEFRAPERPGEPDEQQGAIPGIPDGVAERSHDGGHLFRCEGCCAPLRASVGAPDAAEGQPDELGSDRVRQATEGVRAADCDQAAGEGGHDMGRGVGLS